MKRLFGLCILVLLIACCREEVPPTCSNPLIGKWEIFQVDSGYSPSDPVKGFNFIKQLDYKGSFEFLCDSTGRVNGSILEITGNYTMFVWSYETRYLPTTWIPFAFLSGSAEIALEKVNNDTLSFFFPDILGPQHLGIIDYYHIQLLKH
jgi:hypothetical protein